MKTIEYENNREWLNARLGKITGTKLKGIISKRKTTTKKVGFYELIAERLMVDDGISLDPMERGTYLENYALDIFAEQEGKKVDKRKLMWVHDKHPNIACSPDGVIGKTEVIEVKCLGSARHIEAYLTGKIPSEYMEQATQPFVVNEKLKTLYFVFFDPRMIAKDFFFHTLKREDIAEDIEAYLKY